MGNGPLTRHTSVYPRVGGGTAAAGSIANIGNGLSPRGRGNRRSPARFGSRSGSIPAWAGEPHGDGGRPGDRRVYPRVGGGTAAALSIANIGNGLSPRGRGNHLQLQVVAVRDGSIPAWAGEPLALVVVVLLVRVYPRVGGGTTCKAHADCPGPGLSPRGRGNHGHERGRCSVPGSIPAWAGEPWLTAWSTVPATVYPRVGGGTCKIGKRHHHDGGLSPRGRGNHGCANDDCATEGSIPAWAGEPGAGLGLVRLHGVYPRVGGGTPPAPIMPRDLTGLSPRGRGNRAYPIFTDSSLRSIPAWAGEPDALRLTAMAGEVYPRVGGGTGDCVVL